MVAQTVLENNKRAKELKSVRHLHVFIQEEEEEEQTIQWHLPMQEAT